MFPFNLFPYTNFHELNLDWILNKLKSAVYTVNRTTPDENGNVNLPTVAGVSSVNGVGADGNGNVEINYNNVNALPNTIDPVEKVNNITPDENGNVDVGTVKSVNNISPDNTGNVVTNSQESNTLLFPDYIAVPSWTQYIYKIDRMATVDIYGRNASTNNLYGGTVIATGAFPCPNEFSALVVVTDYDNRPCLAYVDSDGNIKLQEWNYIKPDSSFRIIGTYITV